MSYPATLETILGFLDNGTGDPGLSFEDVEDEVTAITQLREGKHTDLWTVYPITVVNTDGPHELCWLGITICQDVETDDPIFRFLALGQWGEPVAYHEVG